LSSDPLEIDPGTVAGCVQAAGYSAVELLANGCPVQIRALTPEDRDGLLAAVDRTSAQSLYRRFFGVRRSFTEQEIAFFLNIDFINHVALIAILQEGGRQIMAGGGRYIVVAPGTAEVAFAVVDEYQGRGIGAALMRHLVAIARNAGLKEFVAEVLPDNIAMLKVFEKSGLHLASRRDAGVVHVSLELA
jgi:RimJ/RimL family protein N-acetyltransferase